MSFYHILPSNAALNVFPNNVASEFKTPFENPIRLKGEWEIALQNVVYAGHIYSFNNDKIVITENSKVKTIVLTPSRYTSCKDAASFINEKINDKRILFSTDNKNYLKLQIENKNMAITFDDTLRDIFAFDQNSCSGKGSFSGSGEFSLTRRIRFLYIYSNISDMVHIGDIEAPLLAVIPFDASKAMNEVSFEIPMYIRVIADFIPQISISIFDDAGKLVPFIADAKTSLRLHFRRN